MNEYIDVQQDWDILKEQENVKEVRTERTIAKVYLNFGSQIQEARIKKRMTISDVASNLQLPVKTVSMYENCSETPNPEMMKAIKNLLELD